MSAPTLRELAQDAATLDKDSDEFDFALDEIRRRYGLDLTGAAGVDALLAALDAAEARGRARAMREAADRAMSGEAYLLGEVHRQQRVITRLSQRIQRAERSSSERMARAMVAALYWRAGEYLLRARELGASGLDGAAHHLYTRRTAIVVAASHLEQHL